MQFSEDPRILVAYKKSRWEHYTAGDEGDAVETPEHADGTSIEELERSHRIHRSGVDTVLEHLESAQLEYRAAYRGEIDDPAEFDLVVTVGGDGTVLDVSHQIGDVPILAINSHPDSSVGYFCAGTADSFPELLDASLEGKLRAFEVLRFRLALDGERLGPPVLNEVLIGHANPAAVSRYSIQIGDEEAEKQASSGVWVATPAGSTAAIRSAGGYVLPLGCRCIEYLVREPYPLPDRPYRHRTGIRPVDASFRLHSQMQQGRIYVDGPHIAHDFPFGSTVEIDAGAPNLKMIGLQTSRRTSTG